MRPAFHCIPISAEMSAFAGARGNRGKCSGALLRAVGIALATLTLSAASALAQSCPATAPSAPACGSRAVTFAPLIEKALPAVVSILVEGEVVVPSVLKFGAPPPEPRRRPFRSGGSGVIVDATLGIIGTNRHVVQNATTIGVRLHDGREAPAQLLGVDAGADIAILQVKLAGLTEMPIGNSSALRVGDMVFAVGNPFGLEGSASTGIVSGLSRSDIGYDIYESFIQIDAAVNPGNSGGALVNMDGELVGITTAVGRQTGASVGIAFAIPVNMARRIGHQIYQHGRMRRGSIGLSTRDIGSRAAEALKLANRKGAEVSAIIADSPAARAGIEVGSIILAFNGEEIRKSADFVALLGSTAVGEKVELQLLGKGASKAVTLEVSDQVPDPPTRTVPTRIPGIGGLIVQAIAPRSPLYGQLQGVIVIGKELDSPAMTSGLEVGDVITSINQRQINTMGEMADLVLGETGPEKLSIMRDSVPYVVEIAK